MVNIPFLNYWIRITIQKSFVSSHNLTPQNSSSDFVGNFLSCLFVYCVWQFKELDKTLQI